MGARCRNWPRFRCRLTARAALLPAGPPGYAGGELLVLDAEVPKAGGGSGWNWCCKSWDGYCLGSDWYQGGEGGAGHGIRAKGRERTKRRKGLRALMPWGLDQPHLGMANLDPGLGLAEQ